MKKFSFLFLVLLVIPFFAISQNSQGKTDDLGRVSLMAFVPDQAEGIPASARQLLQNKMQQIAVQNGIGGSGANPRFCIVPSVNVMSKEITPTAPPMQALNLEVTFYIVDAASQSIFSQTSISVKGVGQTDDKAYITGLKNINPKAGQFKGFVETGKTKIIEFYNSQCDVIMKSAQALAGQKKYEEALGVLLSVPDVSRECFDKCMTLSGDIYKEYANYKCTEYLSGAKAAWASMNAEKAAEFLGKITPDMACYADATQLVEEIKQKHLADGANVWDFKMKVYTDQAEKDKMVIQATKEVAIAQAVGANRYNWNWLYPNSTFKQVDHPKTTTQPETITAKTDAKVESTNQFGVLQAKVISYNGNFKGNFNLLTDGGYNNDGISPTGGCVFWDTQEDVFFVLDLGDVRQVNGITIGSAGDKTIFVDWSLDGSTYQRATVVDKKFGTSDNYYIEVLSTDPSSKYYEPRLSFNPVKARFFKVYAADKEGRYTLSEVQMLGY